MHQFRDKKQITRKNKFIKNFIIFVIFFIVSTMGLLSLAGNPLNNITRPVLIIKQLIVDGFYNFGYLFKTKSSINKENNNLIEENFRIKTSMIDYQIIKEDNNKLKELLGRLPEANNFILGTILTKPNHSPYDTIIIDIGKNLEMKEGLMVYANGNIPIGYIEKVYDKTSLVSLYTNPGQKTEGFIESSNASVSLTGRGGGNFEMIIPIELIVDSGLIVYLPGSNSLVLATVDEIISTPSDPFKKVILSSPVNVQNLKWIEVKK